MIKVLSYLVMIDTLSQLKQIDSDMIGEPWGESNFYFETELKWRLSSLVLEDDLVLGFLIASRKEKLAHIHRLAVRQEFRGKGYGKLMMEDLIRKAIELDLQGVSLKVDFSNKRAISFYEKIGFIVSERNGDNILMQMSVS
jgi:ribosomal-protein-alanine N-acetyltransferase